MRRWFSLLALMGVTLGGCTGQQVYDTLGNAVAAAARSACQASRECSVGCGDGYTARKSDGVCVRTYR